jgi:hypothetical protein
MRCALLAVLMVSFGISVLAADEYWPLAIGQERTMTVAISMPDGGIIEGTAHRKIEGAATKDGTAYFRSRTWFEGMPFKSGSTKLIRKDEKAVYSIDERVPGSVEQVIVVLPLKVGATWQRSVRGMAVMNTVLNKEDIDVLGKTYSNCYHIQSTWSDGRYTKDSWEAPNVGTVREKISYADGLTFTYTLKDFKPGG